MYQLFKSLAFQLDPEVAHNVTMPLLNLAQKLQILKLFKPEGRAVEALGLNFPNILGMAAGMDKEGKYIDAFADLGFGFVEAGTVTPRAQSGNPKPRLFRLPEAEALINRMGFNNSGVDEFVKNIATKKSKSVLGVNIGKNKDTALEDTVSDYLICLNKVHKYADYIAVNVSSPNTPGLRDFATSSHFAELISAVKQRLAELNSEYQRNVPLLVKVAPDLTDEQLEQFCKILLDFEVEGIVATNTTISRDNISGVRWAAEAGGLSGKPLRDLSTKAIRNIKKITGDKMLIVGVGGISSVADAKDKLEAGADLLQIYTSFIYQGPGLVKNIVRNLP